MDDFNLKPKTPPCILYHGTNDRVLDAILKDGLKPMKRAFVHLTEDLVRAKMVAARRRVGNGVVLVVDTQDSALNGTHFYLGEDDVWLVDHVPPSALEVRK